jgi:hypothetical protein
MATFTNYPTTQPMQLSDMLGDISALQQYKQQQQLMPLALEKAKLEVEQSRAKTPTEVLKAGIEGQVLEQTNKERQALMEFQKNPDNWSTNGRVDIDKLNKAIPLIAPLTGAEHIDKLTKLGDAQTKALESKQNLTQKQREIVSNRFGLLGRLGVENPAIVREELKRLKSENPDNKDLHTLIDAYDVPYSMTNAGPHVAQDLIRASQSMLSPSQQQEALTPKAGTLDTGARILSTVQTPSVGGNIPTTTVGQPLANKEVAPGIFANPISGQPMQVGGANNQPPKAFQGAPGMPPSAPMGGAAPSGILPQGMTGGGQMAQLPQESPENFNKRYQSAQALYTKAVDQYNNPQSQYGHIPTTQQLNSNVMRLLKDPNVETGAIADYFAGKTNKGSLTSKQQELAKYLEQRIQVLGPRTDAAAVNLKNAYGSFNLKKDTLKDLIRQDNIWVTTQDLLGKGTLNNGGRQGNPNFDKVQNFNQQFSLYASNPKLMEYISHVGESNTPEIDDDDRTAFNSFIKNMSKSDRQLMEAKRQELLKLVRGQ